MWTFDGKVPGTTLHGHVGDLFTVTLVNDGTIDHSIDFHASKVAWNDEMRSIAPGESLVYQFHAKHAGAFMYHCGTSPTLHHIGNGMFGAIIVDPPDLAPVDHPTPPLAAPRPSTFSPPRAASSSSPSTNPASTPSSPTSSPTSAKAPSACSRPGRGRRGRRRSLSSQGGASTSLVS